jgi:conjugal transfer pilus assembly protein TraU
MQKPMKKGGDSIRFYSRIVPLLALCCTLALMMSATSARATCCDKKIEEEEIAWEHMDEVDNEGQCECRYGQYTRQGTLVTLWEPVRIIETVKDPHCMITNGENNSLSFSGPQGEGQGVDLNSGTHSDTGSQEDHSVFQQVHIILPDYIMQSIMQVDNRCYHSSVGNPMDYISEDDPAWNDDTIAAATYPETAMFADFGMQELCKIDSVSSQVGFPNSILFWCMGSWGSTFPMSGHVNNDEYVTGNIAAAARAIYVGGRTGRINDAASYYCYSGPMPLWIKHYFKFQPIRPTPREFLIPIGLSPMLWSEGFNDDMACGDNFAWVLWRKRWCCDSQGGSNFNTHR